MPLPHTTKAYGQFLGRDFNPPDLLLLLRTVKSCILKLSQYVVLNPVRARMVNEPGDWQWSSYRVTIGKQDGFEGLATNALLFKFIWVIKILPKSKGYILPSRKVSYQKSP
jgi:hypothetical protein